MNNILFENRKGKVFNLKKGKTVFEHLLYIQVDPYYCFRLCSAGRELILLPKSKTFTVYRLTFIIVLDFVRLAENLFNSLNLKCLLYTG